MKKVLLQLIIVLAISPTCVLYGQNVIPNSKVTGICYAGNKVHRIYIPPRLKHSFRSSSAGKGAINVKYSGFTVQAKDAVEFAVGILEDMLPQDLKITVNATWTKISSSGVLGNSSITGFAGGWTINALNPLAYYPITIAEKIAEKSINEDSEADIELRLNSSINWYFGTDGNTPVNKYDLVTVVLHELCHGLGFYDSMGVNENEGYYGVPNLPVIYDTFVENRTGQRLIDTTVFANPGTALFNELTGGFLYFNGQLTHTYLVGNRPSLYAPSTWDPGSSISHLDESRTIDANALMTPFIDKGEAIHDPGDLTYSILGDLGWINTRIVPTEMKDTEEDLSSIELVASIRSDTTYNKSKVGIVYSYDGFHNSSSLLLSPTSVPDQYSGLVAVPSYNSRLEYYFFVEDSFLRLYKCPSLAEKSPYSVFIGTDTVKPVIVHTPTDYYFEKIDSMLFDAVVTDNLGIDTVYVEFNVNGGPTGKFGLPTKGADRFSTRFNVKPLGLKGGDIVNYRIVAVDRASGHNKRRMPSTGFNAIRIEALLPVVEDYSTDFSDATDDFFNSGFSITQPDGFNSEALHSDHPYKSPEEDTKEFNFSSVLRHPVIYDAAGMTICYRELVLVEPGEEGSVFGFSDFYDYVIMEGSKDYGKNWFPLADGYDSRILSSWETAFSSSSDGQNSTFVGSESMMLPHIIYPKVSDKISNGDSMLVRFRLFSDPFAHGWGWVIDDLKIERLIDDVNDIPAFDATIYPNPGNGCFTVRTGDAINTDSTFLSIFNTSGQCILKSVPITGHQMAVDISGNPSGLYFIIIRDPGGIKTCKYSLLK